MLGHRNTISNFMAASVTGSVGEKNQKGTIRTLGCIMCGSFHCCILTVTKYRLFDNKFQFTTTISTRATLKTKGMVTPWLVEKEGVNHGHCHKMASWRARRSFYCTWGMSLAMRRGTTTSAEHRYSERLPRHEPMRLARFGKSRARRGTIDSYSR